VNVAVCPCGARGAADGALMPSNGAHDVRMSLDAVRAAATEDKPVSRKRRKRRRLTLAEKKFISERMKKYWSARKEKEA
jgi:hypothetical protein